MQENELQTSPLKSVFEILEKTFSNLHCLVSSSKILFTILIDISTDFLSLSWKSIALKLVFFLSEFCLKKVGFSDQ